ncbi:MAG TPA: acyl carrier protein [Stellaceae bacterium]|nr:acyl carrier protein [Stellaceae bacterium]
MISKAEILARLSTHLQEMFAIPPERIQPEARLFEDLDLDSIDAVDLLAKLHAEIGKKITPAEFKSVRTLADIVEKVHAQLSQRA